MSEFSSQFPSGGIPINPISAFKPNDAGWGGAPAVRCEECPAGTVCKRINNFRESCPDGKPEKNRKNGWDRPEKCWAGMIILMDKLLERNEARL